VELGIVASPAALPDVDVEVLGTDRLLLVVHPKHAWVTRPSIGLEELAGERLIVREKTSGTRMLIEEKLAAYGVRPKNRLEFSNTDAIKEAVIAGLGVSLISERATRQEILNRRLFAVPFTGEALSRNICLLTLGDHKLSPAATVLRRLIVADFADLDV
jgi:DNA-binding transcriptional LysR family regulator